MNERSQAVPILILGIAIVMLIYGFLLPIEEKCKLMPGLPECKVEVKEKVLSAIPGLLEPQELSARYYIKPVQLFRKDSLDIATLFEEAEVSNGWFFSAPKRTIFRIQEGGKKVDLFIFVSESKGKLKVKVNGRKIGVIKGEGLHNLSLPLGILEKDNTLELKAGIPLLPWSSERSRITKVLLREEYVITQNRVTETIELKQDIGEVRDAILRFETDCFSDESLVVSINEKKVIEGKICVGFEKDVKEFLNKSNDITFSSEGNYFIDNIRLDLRMKEKEWPTYYFSISEEQLESSVMLNLKFNETGMKKLTVYANGEAFSIETAKLEWKTTLNRYLKEGTNELMFIPETKIALESIEIE